MGVPTDYPAVEDVDDMTALTTQSNVAGEKKGSPEVYVKMAIEGIFICLDEGGALEEGSVVNEEITMGKGLENRMDQRGNLSRVIKVAWKKAAAPARRCDLLP